MNTNKIQRWFARIGTATFVFILFILFIVSVVWFRRPKDPVENHIDSIAEVLRPDPISQAILNGIIDTQSRSATLKLNAGGKAVGQVNRGTKDEHYFLDLQTTLPEIDREVSFYQAWLVRPIPYNFFPIGELVTNEDGIFVLEWEGEKEKDYSGYMRIVVTKQVVGGSEDPQGHIAKGEFGD